MFAHRGNLLRHMALHDPENPGNKELLAEAEEADQTEGYEEEEIGLEAPGQIIQTVWHHHQRYDLVNDYRCLRIHLY